MKISLIHPLVLVASTFEKLGRSHLPPLGILYLASSLTRAGHEVSVHDLNLPRSLSSVLDEVCAGEPDLVGLGSLAPAFEGIASLAATLRRRLPASTALVVGGPDATTSPGAYARLCCFDAIFVGEAEKTLVDFCEAWPRVPEIPGILTPGADPSTAKCPELINPETAPLPSRHLLPIKRYRGGPAFKRQRLSTSIFTHRGCPYTCTFCEKGVHDGPMRFRSAESILEEVRRIRVDHDIHDIRFIDDVFMVNSDVLDRFLELILSSGERFSWLCTARVDHMDEARLRKMRRAGCYRLEVGVESGSDRVLEMVSKHITTGQIRQSMAATKSAGLEVIANFILGFPTETAQEMRKSIDFSIELAPQWSMFFDYYPLPGSPMAREYGLAWDEDRRSFNAPDGVFMITRQELDDIIREAYRRFYFRPGLVLGKLGSIRSGWILRDLALMAGAFGLMTWQRR